MAPTPDPARLYSVSFQALGTTCALHFYAPDEATADGVAEAAQAEVLRIEQRYSRYRDDSLLSAINRVADRGGTIDVDAETAGLLDYAASCYRMSDGRFDITSGVLYAAWSFSAGLRSDRTLPDPHHIDALCARVGFDKIGWLNPRLTFSSPGMALDFGGIGKEYAADRVAAVLTAWGLRHGLVDLGGDLHAIGPHPDGTPWSIGIRHPRRTDTAMATFALTQGGLATSGDYERFIEIDGQRYCHILDPRTGWPVRGLSSVSVIADHCVVAGSVATIALLKGRDGVAWLDGLGLTHLWMDEAGNRGGIDPE